MTNRVVPHGITKGCHMEPWAKDTWHESHVVWMVTPKACVHVTHGHEREERKVRGSILSLGIRPTKWKEKKTNNSVGWDENQKWRKKKNKKKEKRKERKKENKRRKKQKGEEENQAVEGESHTVGEKKKKKRERGKERIFLVF